MPDASEAHASGTPNVNAQILFENARLHLGHFTCRISDPLWGRENYIGDLPHLVFPATAVRIHQAGLEPVLSDPNHVIFYDAGRVYTRDPVSPAGDICTFLMVEEELLDEIKGDLKIREPHNDSTFPHHFAPTSSRNYAGIRLLSEGLRRKSAADALTVEESLLLFVSDTLEQAAGFFGYIDAARPKLKTAHREIVEETRWVLNLHFTERLTLTDLARRVASSPFHLARIFRLHMGTTIHAYRDRLRLRHCLERLVLERTPASKIAAQIGFSSPSHLSQRFRYVFGLTPSAARSMPSSDAWLHEIRTLLI